MTVDDPDDDSDISSFADLVDRIHRLKGPPDSDPDSDTVEHTPTDEHDESQWIWGSQRERSSDESGRESSREPDPGEAETPTASKLSALVELISDQPNVLLIGPSESATDYGFCSRLSTAASVQVDQVFVLTDVTPDERLSALRGYGLEFGRGVTAIAVGDGLRSASPAAGDRPIEDTGLVVDHVSDVSDLTRIGLKLNNALGERAESVPLHLCFHDLSDLLRTVDPERLFRFLHIVTRRVQNTGISAHFHLDPDGLEPPQINTIKPLFDFVIQFDADGEVSVLSS